MNFIKLFFNRILLIVLTVALELALILALFVLLENYDIYIFAFFRIFSWILSMVIIANSKHLSFDIIWAVGILIFPAAVTVAYLLIGTDNIKSKTFKQIVGEQKTSEEQYADNSDILKEMRELAPDKAGQFSFISKEAGYPFYRNTGFDYYGLGEAGYPQMLEDMKNAKEFIFLEYFIVEPGIMWDGMLDILKQKAAEGVEIRFMYDDMGSFTTLSKNYARHLSDYNIKCIAFNRISPLLGAIINHRDHRKIMVIDGKIAYSGGVNLADEYINEKVKYGHWKDNIIRMTGKVVDSYTILFLSHWNALNVDDNEYEKFLNKNTAAALENEFDGYICSYGESPLDDELTSQNVYMNILNQARDYCYIFTPYLIIDTEMLNALILAAKRGVDVRIITPGIPDKKMVWKITRSFYAPLIEGGVKVLEYTPGFIHSKVFVSDDIVSTVGTINLDYRSLYLHFENGTYIYGSSKVKDVKQDFIDAQKVSHQMTLNECKKGVIRRTLTAFLRLLAPLL